MRCADIHKTLSLFSIRNLYGFYKLLAEAKNIFQERSFAVFYANAVVFYERRDGRMSRSRVQFPPREIPTNYTTISELELLHR